ncbi:MAG: carboxylating nicotinate-nucleotide diphosphorylase [Methanobrevibacter thaueri]|nr:carboxylating nicotinate-nucleotide diphosphorylase [Methanobrevibacter thaueri]
MDKIIEYMLAEDKGFGDITSNAVVDEDCNVKAHIISKDEGILAGINIIRDLFEEYGINVLSFLDEGCEISKGDVLISIQGNARTILFLERTALNLIMRMSGVATAANYYVNLVKNTNVIIAGTRKTSPAIGKFDKYALKVGGADTHRFSLDDMVLIKDNHIATCKSPLEALLRAKSNTSFSKKIEIEVETLDDAIDCVRNGADIVMLDNMGPNEVNMVIDEFNKLNIRQNSLIEVSGGITEDTILDYADLDVDIISVGALTHSSKSLNFSLKIDSFVDVNYG